MFRPKWITLVILVVALTIIAPFVSAQGTNSTTTGLGGLPLRGYKFDVVTVDSTGSITNRRKRQARYYAEHVDGVALEMVQIPGGTFLMGTTDAGADQVKREYERSRTPAHGGGRGYTAEDASKQSRWEVPQHTVRVPTFYMGKFEVTQAQWRVVSRLPKVNKDLVDEPSNFKFGNRFDSLPVRFKGDNLPVTQVSWEDAIEFCERLSRATGRTYRLPTEAEWEYAARGGTTTAFYLGETITPELVNYDGNAPYGSAPKGTSRQRSTPVGSLAYPNAFGLYDMAGNVLEWCMDYWHESYDVAPTDGSSWKTAGDTERGVARGGSYYHDGNHSRAAMRVPVPLSVRAPSLGFRVVAIASQVRNQEVGQADPRQWKIAFDSQRDGNRDIYVMDANGGNVRRLTQTSGKLRLSWKPKWSPDRTRIAFHSNRDGTAAEGRSEENEIYVMNANGGNLRRLTNNDAADLDPVWSPDGNKIAFVSHRDGNPEIYVMDADGGNVRRLTNNFVVDREPAWSPDRRTVAFESHRDGNPDIYVMDADGGNVRRLTQNPVADAGADWSPDGARITFRSLRDGPWQIYVMDADGGNVRRLTHDSKASYRANWSRDGTKIVFVSTRDGTPATESEGGAYEIYVMNSDGSNVRRITHNPVFDGHPDW